MENKINQSKKLAKGLLAVSFLGFSAMFATAATTPSSSLFDYTVLGSGAEVRTEMLNNTNAPLGNFEATCGEKPDDTKAKEAKCGEKTGDAKTKEAKTTEAKCGEGKCGAEDKKADKKVEKKADKKTKKADAKAKKSDDKTKEAKCGEGKCGDN